MGDITHCQLCGSGALELVLDMGVQPLAENLTDARAFPLRLVRCIDCDLHQLDYAVEQDILFPYSHPYASGNSAALREHYLNLAAQVSTKLAMNDLVVDIGCNDGTLLRQFSPSYRRLGVEPTGQANVAQGNGLNVIQGFFTRKMGGGIVRAHGYAKAIFANNVLAHVPDLHDFLSGVALMLDRDGVFITENHDVASVLAGQIDTIYHEHLRYWSPTTLARALLVHRLDTYSVTRTTMHGGSFRTAANFVNINLQPRAERARTELRELLSKATQEHGGRIWAVGATTRATPLIHYMGIEDYIFSIADTTGKVGHMLPGTKIPIVEETLMIEAQTDPVLLLAWHLRDKIIPSLRAKGYQGKFIIPLPVPEIVDA